MQNEIKEEKTKRTPKQKVWLGVRIAFNVIFYAIILLVLLFSISNIRAKNEKDRIPNIFGIGYLNVLSDSMEGNYEDSFNVGDMIIVKTASEDRIANLKVGDIVTFYDNNLAANTGVSTALNTHRIVYIDKEANLFYTVGDKSMLNYEKENNKKFDLSQLEGISSIERREILASAFGPKNYQEFGSIEIRGIYSTKWDGFGKVIQTINNHFVSIIILPIAALLLLEIAYLIYNIMKVREEKIKKNLQPEADLVMTDDDKEKLKAELRAQLLAEMGVAAPAANESSEESLEKPTEEASEETKDEAAEDTSALDTATQEQSVEEIDPVEEVTEEVAPVEETPVEEVQVEEKTQDVVEESVKEEASAEVKEETPANEEKSDAKPKKAPAKKTTTTAKKSPASTAKKTTTTKKASTSTTKKTSDTAAKKTTSKSTTAAKKPSTSTATKKAASPKSTTKKSTKAE